MNRCGIMLRGYRDGARLRLVDVAAVVGLSVPYLSQFERSERGPLRPSDLKKLARFYRVDEAEVLRLAELDVVDKWRNG